MKRIAIIGGGISGLAAALDLSAADGYHVTLMEAKDRVGGVLETVRDGPYLVERSADNFATLIPDALQLSKDYGLDSDLIPPASSNRQAFVLNRGRLLPIPAGFSLMQPTRVGSVLATRTLSWPAKLRLLGEYWVPRRESDEDESLESFSTRRLGREAYENLVEPIVSGIFTADPSTLSMRATMPQFVEMERRCGGLIRGYLAAKQKDAAAAARRASGARYDQFLAPRQGMSSWIAGLAAQLPKDCLQLNTSVEEIAPEKSTDGVERWRVSTANGTNLYDAIICSAPAAVTAGLLKVCLPEIAALVASIPYASSAVVAMIVNKAELSGRTDGFGLIVPRKEGRDCLAISYTSNKYPGRVPDDEILLRIFLGGALNPDVVDLDDTKLAELATQELRAILGWRGQKPNWQAVIRWRAAMPQYLVGHTQRMEQLKQNLEALPTLKLCGAAYAGVGIPQCVRGGRQVARDLIEHFQSTSVQHAT